MNKTNLVKTRIRKDRNNRRYTKPTEEIVCAWCKQRFIVEKSYGTWRNGKRITPKNRFCCRDHHWKWHATFGKRNLGARGERNPAYIKLDISQITEMYQRGIEQKDIAKILGVSQSTIGKRIKLISWNMRRLISRPLPIFSMSC